MKLKTILITIICIMLFTSFSYATEDVTTTTPSDDIALINIEPDSDGTIISDGSETATSDEAQDDYSLYTENYLESLYINKPNEDYVLDEIVDGNVIINAKNVSIEAIVGGSLIIHADTVTFAGSQPYVQGNIYICANTVELGKTTMAYSNLFIKAKTATIGGIIYDAFVMADNVTINAEIYRDCFVMVKDTFTLTGSIGRNLHLLNGTKFIFKDEEQEDNSTASVGSVIGDIYYTNTKKIEIPDAVTGSSEKIHATIINPAVIIDIFSVNIIIVFAVLMLIASSQKIALETSYTKDNIIDILKYGIISVALIAALIIIPVFVGIKYFIASTIILSILAFGLIAISLVIVPYTMINNFDLTKDLPAIPKILITFILFIIILFALCVPYFNIILLTIFAIVSNGLIFSQFKIKCQKQISEKTKNNKDNKKEEIKNKETK